MLVETYLDQLDRRRLSGVAAAIRRDYKGTKSQTLVSSQTPLHAILRFLCARGTLTPVFGPVSKRIGRDSHSKPVRQVSQVG